MSFSFRNLFAQDENANSLTGDRTEGSPETGIPGVQEYGVSELLPFIPPAIVAENGIPMDKSIQIILPEDGSNDVRLSTIYQSCPSLFAAEITPLNDSVINLPPKADQATVSPPLSGNPFGDERELPGEIEATDELTGDRTTPPALPEMNQEAEGPNPDFGFTPPPEAPQVNGNPFSGIPPELEEPKQPEARELDSSETSDSASSVINPFSDLSDSLASSESPFETDFDAEETPENLFSNQGQALSDFFSAPAKPEEAGQESSQETPPSPDQASPGEPASQFGEPFFGTDSDSFATLFSQAAQEDEDLPVSESSLEEDGPSVEVMLNEGNSEYVGPSFDPAVSPFAEMDGDQDDDLGFESFIPPNMQDNHSAESELDREEVESKEADEPMAFVPLPTGDEVFSPLETSDQDDQDDGEEESPALQSAESDEEAAEPEDETPEPLSEVENPIDEEMEDAADILDDEESEDSELFQDKPQECTDEESEVCPEVAEETTEPVENDGPELDQNEEPLPELTESKMEKEKSEDCSVLATALLESGVLMTPSGYRIPDRGEAERPPVNPDPVVPELVEVPFSEPKWESEPTPSSRHLPLTPAPPTPSHPYASTGPAMHNIELRAVFATEESFTMTKVAQKVTEMEGVVACAIVTPNDVIENFVDEADAIGHKTRELAEHVRCLAAVTGVEGASYFTLHMDQVIMSFFFGEEHLLGVKHAPDAFKPGAREKLVLVARSLEGLEK